MPHFPPQLASIKLKETITNPRQMFDIWGSPMRQSVEKIFGEAAPSEGLVPLYRAACESREYQDIKRDKHQAMKKNRHDKPLKNQRNADINETAVRCQQN
jgi:hypothetical protein